MMISPRPIIPYWPAYPEPERSRLEASYRAEDAMWQHETQSTLLLNTILACTGPLAIAGGILVLLCPK